MIDILKLNIGIAGCGTMGLPMLEVLIKNGINAFGYDIRPKDNFLSVKNNYKLHQTHSQFRAQAKADIKKFNRDKKKLKMALKNDTQA